jgi:hypothetical protein
MNSLAHSRLQPAALDTPRIQALAAMLAGPLFLTVVTVLTLLELDFMHDLGWAFTADDKVPWPSGLALGDYGALQIANFALAGTLLALFVRGFRHELGHSRSGRTATVLLATIAIGIAVSAFPTDRATAAGDAPNTWHGYLHIIGFIAVAISSLLAPIATALALRRNPRWRGVGMLSIAVVVLEIVFFFPLEFLGDPAFVGYLLTLFGWFAALGARLRNLPT